MVDAFFELKRQRATKELSDEEFARARELVARFLAEHPSIANREFRELTQLNYDQAVTFFNRMIAAGCLVRGGKTTSTRYAFGSKALSAYV